MLESALLGGGVSAPGGGVSVPGGGCLFPGGCLLWGVCLLLGGGIPACTEADIPPPPRGQNHRHE